MNKCHENERHERASAYRWWRIHEHLLIPRHTRRRSHYAPTTFVERGGNVQNAAEAQFDLIAIAVDCDTVTMR